jgi:hypothetical protein
VDRTGFQQALGFRPLELPKVVPLLFLQGHTAGAFQHEWREHLPINGLLQHMP